MTQLLGGIFNGGSLSEFAQQQVSALSASAAMARERALGLGVTAAEDAAQRLERVAQKLREKGKSHRSEGICRRSETLEQPMTAFEQQSFLEEVAEAELHSARSLSSQKNESFASSATLPLCTSATLPLLDTSATLPVEPVAWRPSSGISLASTVVVDRAPEPTWNAPSLPAPVALQAQAEVVRDSTHRPSKEPMFLQLGSLVEVYCPESEQWNVGQVGALSDETIAVDMFDAQGAFMQKSLATGDSCLASFGTHVKGPPPGFQARPSVSRPGQLTYVNVATEDKYRCAEHAWQEYINSLLRVAHEGTAKVLRPRESPQDAQATTSFDAAAIDISREVMPLPAGTLFPEPQRQRQQPRCHHCGQRDPVHLRWCRRTHSRVIQLRPSSYQFIVHQLQCKPLLATHHLGTAQRCV